MDYMACVVDMYLACRGRERKGEKKRAKGREMSILSLDNVERET